ncbi:hypothetical protein [Anaerolinea sp.]|uniref:hypothetical protein n=1 Tax=Anaerolinea sp. TaxID=1872519 RepID=UPI002ACDBB17|nr:hypothetical protein [Anaerolinea sp.]
MDNVKFGITLLVLMLAVGTGIVLLLIGGAFVLSAVTGMSAFDLLRKAIPFVRVVAFVLAIVVPAVYVMKQK